MNDKNNDKLCTEIIMLRHGLATRKVDVAKTVAPALHAQIAPFPSAT